MSDEIIFAAEDPSQSIAARDEYWKLLIVDDEAEVHQVTRLVLKDFSFMNKQLQFFSAYHIDEAKKILNENNDLAVILLDIVMEKDESGFELIHFIREEMKNKKVRIIIRTGQPGQAPEEKVILNYDINDYKAKTELTSQKLFTAIISSLRSYRDIVTIEINKKGLEKIIEASAHLFEHQSMHKFATGVLTQLVSILNLNQNAFYSHSSGLAITQQEEEFFILAATGDYELLVGKDINSIPDQKIIHSIKDVLSKKRSLFQNNKYIGYFKSKLGSLNILYFATDSEISELDRNLINIFYTNVSIAYDNLYLNSEIENTQKEIIYRIGEMVDLRSKETGGHIKRVSAISKFIALKYGMSEEEADVIKLAASLHDVGKIGIPDEILNKPGELSDQERKIIELHPKLGYNMLKDSQRRIIKAAAIIALQHHERYDGKGYPNQLKGENIHIYARITALVDVFDALSNDRVYKKAQPKNEIIDYYKNERDKSFDARLVEIFVKNIDEIYNIKHWIDRRKRINWEGLNV